MYNLYVRPSICGYKNPKSDSYWKSIHVIFRRPVNAAHGDYRVYFYESTVFLYRSAIRPQICDAIWCGSGEGRRQANKYKENN